MQSIFIVASGQHVGKTTLSLGLISLLVEQGRRVHFFKPVGQEYVERDGTMIDKDAVFMQTVMSLGGTLAEMSPVTIPRGFVENYLFHRDVEPLKRRIFEAYGRVSQGCDVLVVEGTGHAGVGACLDLSNADVAAMLDISALLVVEGGIGSTLDQVALNLSLFQGRQVKVVGVVANKVIPEKRERITQALDRGLANMGLKLLGSIPYDETLTYPRMRQVAQNLSAQVLSGESAMDVRIDNTIVAAMEPQNVLPHIGPHTLMITSGDRIDNILVAINKGLHQADHNSCIVGLVLTGGLIPHFTIVSLMKNSGLPVLLCKEDTYTVATRIKQMVIRILPEDADKIAHAKSLARQYVNIDAIFNCL
ncbi:MAG: AAA family ATPase [Phycisphaerae bacterium]